MKTSPRFHVYLPSLAASLFLTGLPAVLAETPAEKTPAENAAAAPDTVSTTGKIFSVEPEIVSVVIENDPTPVRFQYSKETPWVDEEGTAVPMEMVRPDLPITVQYVMEGETMVARHVVVTRMRDNPGRPAEKKRAEIAAENQKKAMIVKQKEVLSPDPIMGTVSGIEQTISVVPRGSTRPEMVIINNSTRFVNASGEPVSTDLVFSGMPVTVKCVSDGERKIAQEITIRGDAASVMGRRNPDGDASNDLPGTARSGSAKNAESGGNNGADYIPEQGLVIPGLVPAAGSTPASGANAVNPPSRTAPGQPARAGENPQSFGNRNSRPNAPAADNQPNPDNRPNPDNQPEPAQGNSSDGSAARPGTGTSGSGSTGGASGSASGSGSTGGGNGARGGGSGSAGAANPR